MYAKLIFARITNDISCRSAARYYVYMYTGINGTSYLEDICASLITECGVGGYIIRYDDGALDL